MAKAVIYTRFSPRKNADDSKSCETQEALCREYAEANGHTVVDVYADKALSGGETDRPGLWASIAALKRGYVLIVYRRDRLARDTYLAESIRRHAKSKGATIEALAGDIDGDENDPAVLAFRKIMDVIDELARKTTASRTSHAMKQHQKNGRLMGRYAPYGWEIDPDDSKRLIQSVKEQGAIRTIVQLMLEEGSTVNNVTVKMNKLYPELARAGTWQAKTVTKILRREDYLK